ncbi:NAD(P)-dependent alcohol dehydrogenase [Lentzea sp. NPDC059081]|uniref:NAD(P)-dependent alcohol dehydrogenase n=1 Tax=Lentzea sp. NPDC059081 TaxID=3346719 RepID=UPI0036B3D2A7
MKAIVQDYYGSPDALRFEEVETPTAADDEVVVRVHAASVNPYDWHVMRGDPYLSRLVFGLGRPRRRIRGRDFAGRVDSVGTAVTSWRRGDEVFGDLGAANGAFAEYVSLPATMIEAKPATLTFEQAAALPLAATTALTCLRDAAEVEPGQRILVNGASGGVGTFAVQLAKTLGADVTAVCSTANVELLESIGADHVIDHTREDFSRCGRRHDVVLDLVGNRSLTDCRRVLTPRGTLVLSGGGSSRGGSLVGPMGLTVRGQVLARFVRHRVVAPLAAPGAEKLATLRELAESGRITPVIDRTFPLSDAAEAIRYLELGHASGKVVITV